MLQQISEGIRNSAYLSAWLIAPAAFFLSVMVMIALQKSILALVRSFLAGRKRLAWAESLMDALSPALTIAIFSVGVAIVDRILPLSPKADHMFDLAVAAGFILALI